MEVRGHFTVCFGRGGLGGSQWAGTFILPSFPNAESKSCHRAVIWSPCSRGRGCTPGGLATSGRDFPAPPPALMLPSLGGDHSALPVELCSARRAGAGLGEGQAHGAGLSRSLWPLRPGSCGTGKSNGRKSSQTQAGGFLLCEGQRGREGGLQRSPPPPAPAHGHPHENQS